MSVAADDAPPAAGLSIPPAGVFRCIPPRPLTGHASGPRRTGVLPGKVRLMSFRWMHCLVVLCALAGAGAARANSVDTPAELPGAAVVSAEEARRLMAAGAVLVDTRVGNEFAESHIRGAISVPYKEASRKAKDFDATRDRFDLAKLPADRARPVIFYCNSGDCWKSYKASSVAVRAGFKQVYWFRGGYPEWKKKGLPVD